MLDETIFAETPPLSIGAFCPATGEALTKEYLGRTINNWVDFLGHVEQWVPTEHERLNVHRATDVLLFCLHHPRWEFVFQPKYTAYLDLIEPWRKMLRSLALKGRCFESWGEIVKAVEKAIASTSIGIHRYGGGGAGTVPVENPASRRCQKQHRLAGCTTQMAICEACASCTFCKHNGLGNATPCQTGGVIAVRSPRVKAVTILRF